MPDTYFYIDILAIKQRISINCVSNWIRRFTYVYLIETPEKFFTERTKRGLTEKLGDKFMAINFVDAVDIM